jgi:ABC-type Mn2+/Zn2+ transport system permease subunit
MNAQMFFALLTTSAIVTACAVLSVPVVLRRWAFIGEGIGHSGFGGAGCAWMLAVVFPALDNSWAPYVSVVIFCLATALTIGWFSRSDRVNADAVIGIFLVASMAWGFLAQHVYTHHYHGRTPAWFDTFLFGQTHELSSSAAVLAAVVCFAVIVTVAMLGKEITAYCFDPTTAYTSGVRAGMIHYLLMGLIALVIVVGMRVAGSVLITALLVLPGAIAMLLSRRLGSVIAISIASALISAIAGLLINVRWHFLPMGPAIVLVLVIQFVVAYLSNRARST